MRCASRLVSCGLAAGLVSSPAVLRAQSDDCFPPTSSNEAQTLAILSVPVTFGASGAPDAGDARFELGVEGGYIPNVDSATRTPTICRPGKGPENVNRLSAYVRLRAAARLPAGFRIEAGWIPPVRVNGVRPNLLSLALSRPFVLGAGEWTLRARGWLTVGEVEGPFTCPDEALDDIESECFNGTRSEDTWKPNIFGIEAALGWAPGTGRLRPYLGAGYNRLQPRFQVHFVNQFGVLDDRKVEVDLDRLAVFGGASWLATESVGLTGEIYAQPADAVTGRVIVRVGLGG